jgi:ketosteroid isomerase-like protein
MNRRNFVTASVLLVAAGCTSGQPASADETAIKQLISDYYTTYFRALDKVKYGSLLADDYLLLEDGVVISAADDIAAIPAADSGYERSDAFDFRLITVKADSAYAVYFLRSDITDKKEGRRHREWLESAVLRRRAGAWQVALLHSTRIGKPAA